jgi:AcrR family transcriptional regulator
MDATYSQGVPKLWSETIEEHRREVRAAILDTTAALVTQHGLRGATMSRIADETGIGRATLYKYFPDVEAILAAWHERQVDAHLAQLTEIRDRAATDPARRLAAVLEAYAQLSHVSRDNHDRELTALLHSQGPHREPALRRVHAMIRDLLAEAAQTGDIRGDVPPEELADYCLHALGAAAGTHTKPAVERLVRVTMAGLRPG